MDSSWVKHDHDMCGFDFGFYPVRLLYRASYIIMYGNRIFSYLGLYSLAYIKPHLVRVIFSFLIYKRLKYFFMVSE